MMTFLVRFRQPSASIWARELWCINRTAPNHRCCCRSFWRGRLDCCRWCWLCGNSKTLKNPLRSRKIMEYNILFLAVIEVLGKPKEHVESAIKEYIVQLKQNPKYKVL